MREKNAIQAIDPARLHAAPSYSSWINHVGDLFSLIPRNVIARNIFFSV
ncbi:hypothetical protein PSAC2689_170096 [Paraburkholderia sacchari]